MDRRTFLKRTGAVGAGILSQTAFAPRFRRAQAARPNILFIIVDQMRFPQWFGRPEVQGQLVSLAQLEAESVAFHGHYTAANMCRPARSTLLTGLYAHQTGILLTASRAGHVPSLQTGFPTFGTALRDAGYTTTWYGKWHLSETETLEPYGFSGGTFPSPNGGAGEGERVDPEITDQFLGWLAGAPPEPWFTAVSYVNPHDIAWYFRGTDAAGQGQVPSEFRALPANFETPAELRARDKPRLQTAMQEMAALALGHLAYRGADFEAEWLRMLDVYLDLQRAVDGEIGRVLAALAARPAVAANTVVVFTADHGEYAGSHGLRGKGAAAYEEAIHVPLLVRDPTGRYADAIARPREQLTSSVDLFGLFLTLATGGQEWRGESAYAHLAGRLDLAALLADPEAPGRAYVVHTTDEDLIEQAPHSRYARDIPTHVTAVRSEVGKLGAYSYWVDGSLEPVGDGREEEFYDYTTADGALEVANTAGAGGSALEAHRRLLEEAWEKELRSPLPPHLQPVQAAAYAAYLALQGAAPPDRHLHLPWAAMP
jgi:arylsulfatase A-like enzyme